jgi:hypothetical protein
MFVKSRSSRILSRILAGALLLAPRSFAGSDENHGVTQHATSPQISSISPASKPVIVFRSPAR